MALPPKTMAKRKRKIELTKNQIVLIIGIVALVMYLILTIVSAVYLSKTANDTDTPKKATEISSHCTATTTRDKCTAKYVEGELKHAVGVTVRLIFWTWSVIIYVMSIMVYIVYAIAAWQQSHSLGRAWLFVIGVITILNFVPCSYIFTFGDLNTTEKVTYFAMLGVILAFRILDLLAMLYLLKDIKFKKELQGIQTTMPPSTAQLQAEVPPPSGTAETKATPGQGSKVGPEPGAKMPPDPGAKDTPGNPFEEKPPPV